MESVAKMLKETGLELRIENNRKNHDETTMFLYNVENYFIIGANDETLDRDKLHESRMRYHV